MPNRADFYVGRGVNSVWLGSIGKHGSPDQLPDAIKNAIHEEEYALAAIKMIEGRKDGTLPKMGWPWVWTNSLLTNYTYAFDEGKVWGTRFGYAWSDTFDRKEMLGIPAHKQCSFPDMADIQDKALDARSGLDIPDILR